MICNYRRLPAPALKVVLENPSNISDFLYPEDANIPSDQEELDIDKSWQAIHFLINGDPWTGSPPQFNVVLGGTEIGDVDVGYGPARYLDSDEVKRTSIFLTSVTSESLLKAFNLDTFRKQDIYPSGWEGSQQEKEYIIEYFGILKGFFTRAEAAGNAVIIYLN
jgi:hypothetical protein